MIEEKKEMRARSPSSAHTHDFLLILSVEIPSKEVLEVEEKVGDSFAVVHKLKSLGRSENVECHLGSNFVNSRSQAACSCFPVSSLHRKMLCIGWKAAAGVAGISMFALSQGAAATNGAQPSKGADQAVCILGPLPTGADSGVRGVVKFMQPKGSETSPVSDRRSKAIDRSARKPVEC